jgi:hypothetical protein
MIKALASGGGRIRTQTRLYTGSTPPMGSSGDEFKMNSNLDAIDRLTSSEGVTSPAPKRR